MTSAPLPPSAASSRRCCSRWRFEDALMRFRRMDAPPTRGGDDERHRPEL